VALKSSSSDFLQEVAYHKLVADSDSQIVNCRGISQNHEIGDYLM
ncbi:31527_t:CDS:1, partial [Gigaspora margarita]